MVGIVVRSVGIVSLWWTILERRLVHFPDKTKITSFPISGIPLDDFLCLSRSYNGKWSTDLLVLHQGDARSRFRGLHSYIKISSV